MTEFRDQEILRHHKGEELEKLPPGTVQNYIVAHSQDSVDILGLWEDFFIKKNVPHIITKREFPTRKRGTEVILYKEVHMLNYGQLIDLGWNPVQSRTVGGAYQKVAEETI